MLDNPLFGCFMIWENLRCFFQIPSNCTFKSITCIS